MSSDSLLRVFIQRIVKNLSPPNFDVDQTEALFEELLHSIENGAGTNTNYNLDEIVSEIQPKLSSNTWLQFQRNLGQLLNYKDQNTVARYLFLLKSLVANDHVASTNNDQRPVSYNYDNFDKTSFAGSEYQRSLHGQTIDSFENVNFDRFSDRRSAYSAASRTRETRMYSFQELLRPYFEDQVSEPDLLKYIPYTLSGTTSDILTTNGDEINLPENITNGLSGELHIVLEMALLYQELSKFVTENRESGNNSQTKVAVLSFIQDQLDEYLSFINELSLSDQFSLKSIYSDLYDELVKLRFIRFISQKLNSMLSYEVLSTLYCYSKHGDATIRQCSLEFLKYCVSTFSSSIFSWLLDGELNQSFEDFFISNETSNKFSFHYHKERLPTFFSNDTSLKIYNIGLTSRFLKLYCKETKWINEYSDRMKGLFEREKAKSNENDIVFWGSSSTQRQISRLHNEIINYFNYTIFHKFHYFEIVSALKDYLLMGRGDFIESLILNGTEVLNGPSNSLSGYQLSSLLKQSVLTTRSRYDLQDNGNKYVLDKLDARLLSIGHGNIGWDVFTLDYRIDSPLSIILDTKQNDFKKDYLRVFNHLWRIKRLDNLYSETWKETRLIKKFLRDKKFKRFKLVQNFFYSFIKSIKSYILNNVIKLEFNKFIRKLKDHSGSESINFERNHKNMIILQEVMKPNNEYLQELNGSDTNYQKLVHDFSEFTIDQIKSTHQEFLSSIIMHKLINGSDTTSKGKTSGKTYVSQLNSLINIAFKFILTMKELHDVKYNSQHSKDIQLLRREGNIYDNLLNLFQDFNGNLKAFVNDLTCDDDLELRYLGVSLNQ